MGEGDNWYDIELLGATSNSILPGEWTIMYRNPFLYFKSKIIKMWDGMPKITQTRENIK